ncbi:unnamed protein product, partial [marine sediment metagenome]
MKKLCWLLLIPIIILMGSFAYVKIKDNNSIDLLNESIESYRRD